ncbi:hypothetical protein CPB83DRAFT_880497 [Crepidotus variabilis]|uniref:Uncharacterized protein n=1 Tax=Crepidotus variabilis TaxID=179855 RepID=A0A9P6EP87_9AGAR|nr:hypothetical protein CPB83DRAFT_880497 [Crepidotus variabilis]
MSLSNDGLNFTANFLTFLSLAGSVFLILRYLDPWHGYLTLAEAAVELRKLWTDYSAEGALPRGQLRSQFFQELKSLEDQVWRLAYLQNCSMFQPLAWVKALRLKASIAQARLLRINLLNACEQSRYLRQLSIASELADGYSTPNHLEMTSRCPGYLSPSAGSWRNISPVAFLKRPYESYCLKKLRPSSWMQLLSHLRGRRHSHEATEDGSTV